MDMKQYTLTIELPEWAKYLATDYDGELYAYENKPVSKTDKIGT